MRVKINTLQQFLKATLQILTSRKDFCPAHLPATHRTSVKLYGPSEFLLRCCG